MIKVPETRENLISDLMDMARIELHENKEFQSVQRKYDRVYKKFCELLDENKKLKNIYFELQWMEGEIADRMERQLYEKGLIMGNHIEILMKKALEDTVDKVVIIDGS